MDRSSYPLPVATGRPLDVHTEGTVFWRLRGALLRNALRQTFVESRLRLALVLVFSVLFWLALFWLFVDGFRFVASSISQAALRERIVAAIFNVFFLSLMIMLVFSTGIIVYGGLFRGRETQFLLTLPARAERVFLHKFQEAIAFSSWGFLLLGSPMLVAYGLVTVAPWYYYALLAPAIVSFVYIPGAAGALFCLLIVHRLPALKLHLLAVTCALTLLAAGWFIWSVAAGPQGELMTPAWFQDMLGRLQFSEQRLLPSWWLTSGLVEAAAGQWSESLLFLSVLASNALFVHVVVVALARRLFRAAFHAQQGDRSLRHSLSFAWIDRVGSWCLWFLPRQMRLLLVKDLRLFRRDPVQWTQFLIFFGLLGLYFVNIRRLSYDLSHSTWVNMVSFLNLAVVGLILSTFTSRFIFPLISLEGRRFWILCRLPLRRRTILWSKFLFAAFGSLVPCSLLVLLSDVMLRVLPLIIGLHLLICVILCLGLSGLAVGMGALLPNLREDSPSKIAAGFGGTLNLVVSTAYIAVIVLLTALPCHFYLGARQADPESAFFNLALIKSWIVGGAVASVALGALATVVPLRMGFRAFDELEF